MTVVAVPIVLTREDTKRHALDDAKVAGLEQRLRAAGAAVYPWMPGQGLEASLTGGRSRVMARFRLKGTATPPEDSIALRVVVAVAVEVAILAVVAQPQAVEPFTAIAAVVLAPIGYLFSYRRRARSSAMLKVLLSIALMAALGQFMSSASSAVSVDQARLPLATLFLWVQVLHAFDVPRRRDLAFSMVSSLILMAEAASLSLSSSFLMFVVPWMALAGAWLSLSSRPRPDQVVTPVAVRREDLGGDHRHRRTCAVGPDLLGGRRGRGLPRLPGDAEAARHVRAHAPVLVDGAPVAADILRRRGPEPGTRRIQATESSTSAPTRTRGSATSSTFVHADGSPIGWSSGSERRRQRCGEPRSSIPTTGRRGRWVTRPPSICRRPPTVRRCRCRSRSSGGT